MNNKKNLFFMLLIGLLSFVICDSKVFAEDCYYMGDDLMIRRTDGNFYVDYYGTVTRPRTVLYDTATNCQDSCSPYICVTQLTFSGIIGGTGASLFFGSNIQYTSVCLNTYNEMVDYRDSFIPFVISSGAFVDWFARSQLVSRYCAQATDRQTYWRGYAGDDPFQGTVEDNCDLIDPEIRDLINEVLSYIRIAVPLIIIGFSTYELAKAIATGEEEMKKAQKRLVQRLAIGIAIFLVPLLINIVFDIAEGMWQNSGLYSCDINGNIVGRE